MNTEPGKNMAGGEISQRANKAARDATARAQLNYFKNVAAPNPRGSLIVNTMTLWAGIKEALCKANYLELCSRFPAPIPASELVFVEVNSPELTTSQADIYGFVHKLGLHHKCELQHVSEQGMPRFKISVERDLPQRDTLK